MDIFTFFIVLLLALGTVLILSQPFLEKARIGKSEIGGQPDLKAEYERLVSALQELDFDHNLGKFPEEEYKIQRAALMQAGAAALKQLETIKAPSGAGNPNKGCS